jgi:hypothetical protein
MNANESGVTETERMLTDFCKKTFLKLWAYPNPYKDDGKELCDLLAVFDNQVLIFFDRNKIISEDPEKDPQVIWDRWKKNVIDKQVNTAHGAARYIKAGRPIFLDAKKTKPFPIPLDLATLTTYKIVVAHGAKEACENWSPENIYGSLALTYSDVGADLPQTIPFHLNLDKTDPVHIFDSHNLPILLTELDTIADFSGYLADKERAIHHYDLLSYCGEEDLLAHYILNFNEKTNSRSIQIEDEKTNALHLAEGGWSHFIASQTYKDTKAANQVSYFWDELIQRTCGNSLEGTLGGNSSIEQGKSAIYEMAKERRFIRRSLSEKMLGAVHNFSDKPNAFIRRVTYIPSFIADVGYVFLQVRIPEKYKADPELRTKRQTMLEIACGAAKNKFSNLQKVIGIGIENPKFTDGTAGEDFILMPCADWPDDVRASYEEQNLTFKFFSTPHLIEHNERLTEFVNHSDRSQASKFGKTGRNEPCPCGSGKKFKKCHG